VQIFTKRWAKNRGCKLQTWICFEKNGSINQILSHSSHYFILISWCHFNHKWLEMEVPNSSWAYFERPKLTKNKIRKWTRNHLCLHQNYIRSHLSILEGSHVATHVQFIIKKKNLGQELDVKRPPNVHQVVS
jgi:hypothetical protein